MILHKENIPFTMVANEVLRDPNLSLKAKGLFAYLFSKPDDWDFSSNRMVLECKEDRKTIMVTLRELEATGYLKRERLPNGKMDYTLKYNVKSLSPEIGLGVEKPKSVFAPEAKRPRGNFGPISNTEDTTKTEEKVKQKYSEPEVSEKIVGDSGFPLPEGWTETNHGLDDAGTPQISVKDEFGRKVTAAKIKSLYEAYKRSQGISSTPYLGSAGGQLVSPAKARRTKPERGEFDYEKELLKLNKDSWKPKRVISLIWRKKGYKFENWKQFDAQLARDIKPATTLEGYEGYEISRAVDRCIEESQKMGYDWGVSTVAKKIANVINK